MRFRGSLARWWRKAKPKFQTKLARIYKSKVVDCGDFRMRLHPEDNFTERHFLAKGRFPEAASMQWLADNVAGKKGLFLDIGANAGVFTLKVTRAMTSDSLALAFEPNPTLVTRLQQNLRLNKITNVIIHPCALGEETGSGQLSFQKLERENLGAASLHKHQHEDHSITVPVQTLLASFPNNWADFDTIALKIDVEGYEDRILAPFFEQVSARMHPNFIVMEINHADQWQVDMQQILLEHGYSNMGKLNNNLCYVRNRG